MKKSGIHFWTQQIEIDRTDYNITMATTPQGLCWLGLGRSLEEEEVLTIWAKRWFCDQELIRQRQANTKIIKEIEEYLATKRQEFTVPLHLMGTPFQIRVWQELCRIPYGETRSYSDIAEQIGCPKGPRAIGLANKRNPIALVIPCHRVIGKNGSLTGYDGGLDLKRKLLKLEGVKI